MKFMVSHSLQNNGYVLIGKEDRDGQGEQMATALGKKVAVKEAKTYDFVWEATLPGAKDKKKGEMNAASANVVRVALRRQGLVAGNSAQSPPTVVW
jgi:Type II secretory pathway, component PulF